MVQNRIVEFVFTVIFMGIMGFMAWRVKASGQLPTIRKIPALDAIEEAVGRATEMGRPCMVVPGSGTITDASATQTMAGLAILSHSAQLCAKYHTRLLVTTKISSVYALALEIVRDASMKAGDPNLLRADTVQFLSEEQFAWTMGTINLMQTEKIGSAILTGFFQAEAMLLAEAAGQLGAITIGGTARLSIVPYFVVACDYCLIGEELMVAGAYLSKDPASLGAVAGQDICKSLLIVMTAVGVIMGAMGNKALLNLLKS